MRETGLSSLAGMPTGACSCGAFEPIVATHPTDPNRIAVAYQRYRKVDGHCYADSVVAISHDAGRTWKVAPGCPWLGSGRGPDHHSVIAWGPGPEPGTARLYWADAMADPAGGHLAGVAWSDNEGASWSQLYLERRTPPWVGGFPDITVDTNPASPNYGVVYVAYNWLADARKGPGLHVIASADFGRTWQAIEVPPAPGPRGYEDTWRIDYRLRTGPDGSLYVSFYQADLRVWDSRNIWAKGGMANVGRLGFAVARVTFHRSTRTFSQQAPVMAVVLPRNGYTVNGWNAPGTSGNVYVDPMWSQGLDVDPVSGRVLVAVGVFGPSSKVSTPRGSVVVARSDDHGRTWSRVTVPALPELGGRPQSSFKPNLVAGPGFVFVGYHGITDVPEGTSPARHEPTVGTYFAVSFDGGQTFASPAPVTPVRWNAAALATSSTGPGLRERADRTAEGDVYFVYGDGRDAAPPPAATAGSSAVFGALIDIATEPSPGSP